MELIDKLIGIFDKLLFTDRFKVLLSLGTSLIVTQYFPVWQNKIAECVAVFCLVFAFVIAVDKIYRKIKPMLLNIISYLKYKNAIKSFLKRLTIEETGPVAKLWYSESYRTVLDINNGINSLLKNNIIFIEENMKYHPGQTDLVHYMFCLNSTTIKIMKKNKEIRENILKYHDNIKEMKLVEQIQRNDISKISHQNTINNLKSFYEKRTNSSI
jgi:hypothetical protein